MAADVDASPFKPGVALKAAGSLYLTTEHRRDKKKAQGLAYLGQGEGSRTESFSMIRAM